MSKPKLEDQPGMRREAIEAVRNLPQDPRECIAQTTSPTIEQLRRCLSYGEFRSTLSALVAPEKYCAFCSTQLSQRKRVPEWNFGHCLVLIDEGRRLVIPALHRAHRTALTFAEQAQMHLAQGHIEERFHLSETQLLSCLDDPDAELCTIEHLHYRVVTREEFRDCITRQRSRPGNDLIHEYERLLSFVATFTNDGGFGALFPADDG